MAIQSYLPILPSTCYPASVGRMHLVADSPLGRPLHVLVLLVRACHSPADGDEDDVEADNNGVQQAINGALQGRVAVAHRPVNEETESQDGKVESRVIVMDVGYARHDNKRQIVKEPADHRVDAGVVNLINLLVVQVFAAALPAQDVPGDDQAYESESSSGAEVDKRVTKKEVLDNVVVPTAHAQTNIEDGPLPPLGGQIVLLIGIGHQGIVRCHHGDIKMNEIVEER